MEFKIFFCGPHLLNKLITSKLELPNIKNLIHSKETFKDMIASTQSVVMDDL